MGDAWIYAESAERGGEIARLLAELGFSPHRVSANGTLRPGAGETSKRPDVAMVLGLPGPGTYSPGVGERPSSPR